LKIPISDFNEVLVNYPGRWKDTFVHFSYLEILKAYDQFKNNNGPEGILSQLKNKVVFIGLTAAGTVDLRANPIENNYPMLGLNASLFNSFINQDFIRVLSKQDIAFLNSIVFLMSLLLALKFKPLISFFGNIFFACFYLILAFFLLAQYGFWIPMFQPVFIITLVYLVSASMRWLGEEKQRKI